MLLVYVCAVSLGAGLLFLVQPLIGKTLLPLLGGSPAVWNTCMVFFQATLLAGYLYAHALAKLRSRGRQVLVHAAVLAAALALLPVGLPGGWSPPTDRSPVGWLLLALAASVGGPFFALSSAAPLLQSWFARSGHRSSSDPYFLYAASNAGSVAALLAYPLLVERSLGLPGQRRLWSIGFVVFAATALACGLLGRDRPPADAAREGHPRGSSPLDWGTGLRWTLLAFVPSSLMLGATQHLSTDISPLPLLWVVPLALYLLSFVVVFSRGGERAVPAAATLLPVLAVLVAVQLMMPLRERGPLALQFALHLLALLAGALVCHGRLAAERPGTDRLTDFYLLVAAGGVLGGIFNALVAPVAFDWIAEYPVALVLACVLRPRRSSPEEAPALTWRKRLFGAGDLLVPALLVPLIIAAPTIVARLGSGTRLWSAEWNGVLACALPGAACLLLLTRRLRFALGLAVLLLVPRLGLVPELELIHMERTFFGVHRVLRQRSGEGSWHYLWHGSTRHGAQYDREPLSLLPTTYYAPSGPIGEVLGGLAVTGEPRRMAFVGLGAGTLAAYGRPEWRFTFYEVDPAVVRIATDPRFFTYVRKSRSPVDFVLGDARLTLASAPGGHYHAIVLDAFSSDAVPVHLITREAVELYLDKLVPDGILVFHVSNLHLDLAPVLARIAEQLGLLALECEDLHRTERQRLEQKNASKWVVLAPTRRALRRIAHSPRWIPLRPASGGRIWTDDYSNVLGALSE